MAIWNWKELTQMTSKTAQLQALLFVAGDEGIKREHLAELLQVSPAALRELAGKLQEQLAKDPDSGLQLIEINDELKMTTSPACSQVVEAYFNKDLTKRIGLTNARIYASVDNVATITSYSGMDPELYGYNDNPLHAGIDMINYPAPRIFSFGVNLTF